MRTLVPNDGQNLFHLTRIASALRRTQRLPTASRASTSWRSRTQSPRPTPTGTWL